LSLCCLSGLIFTFYFLGRNRGQWPLPQNLSHNSELYSVGGPTRRDSFNSAELAANTVVGEAKALQHFFIEDIPAINNKWRAHSVKHLVVFG